jgi:nuclear-control-of-ATPase protein 2
LELSTTNEDGASAVAAADIHDPRRVARIEQLQRLIKSLSTTNSAKNSLVPASKIRSILQEADISSQCATCAALFEQDDAGTQHGHPVDAHESSYEHELEWLLLSKATTQAYGSVLSTILEQTIPLEDDIWYWDDIISTYRFAGLYSIQTSPIRIYNWSRDVYRGVKARGGRLAVDGWQEFYSLVRDTIKDRNVREIQRRVVSPLGVARNEGRKKSAALRRIKMKNANALGLLLGEGLGSER